MTETQPDEQPEQDAEPSERTVTTKQTSVARSAGIVSIAVMFSRLLGLVREMVFADLERLASGVASAPRDGQRRAA